MADGQLTTHLRCPLQVEPGGGVVRGAAVQPAREVPGLYHLVILPHQPLQHSKRSLQGGGGARGGATPSQALCNKNILYSGEIW